MPERAGTGGTSDDTGAKLVHAQEVHFGETIQLTRGTGENAEAYWSYDGEELIFQSKRDPFKCDQIFRMRADGGGEPKLISTGAGRTTCSYFVPGVEKRVVWSSTHEASPDCPPEPDRSQGYVWPIYDAYDIYSSKPDGTDLVKLTDSPKYDAEATVCPVDGTIIFTSTRDGDLDLYKMNPDGTDVVRLTSTLGYDGGAFFSRDCKKIVWRASRPKGAEAEDYKRLLSQGLVRPSRLELFVANADGTDARQVTYLGAASFAPYFFPDGDRIIFSSNYGDPRGREFELWAVNVDGTKLEQITFTPGFDGFPMFSPDGTKLAFGSNRNQANRGETDVYVAEWNALAPKADQPQRADRVMEHIAWLADDQQEGRGVGTDGLARAADYVADQLGMLDLKVERQPFEVTVAVERADGTALEIDGKPVAADDFTPVGASESTTASGRVVFANYGITAKELGVDDYKRVKAKGKIVVVRRFTPTDGKFEDAAVQRRYSDLIYKALNARDHGAVAVVVVDTEAEESPLPALRVARHGGAGIPLVVVKQSVGAALLKGRHSAVVAVALETRTAEAHNVYARIEAGGDKLPGVVVIGAHYDHLGKGGEGSLLGAHGHGVRTDEPQQIIHNGADDNASGTAALLEAGRWLVQHKADLRRDVVLVAFSAEETGLIGSTQFTRSPPKWLDMKNVVAMLNMDMVGRLRNNQLSVIGAESAEEWTGVVEPACAAEGVECALSGDGYGPSDQTPFYAAGVPVLHFFTGAHEEYHTPDDDASLINAAGAARVAGVVAAVAHAVANRDARLTYKQAPAPERGGDMRSFGASLGTIPDYSGSEDGEPGVLLAGVRAGGPAELGGMQRGDRIVKMGKQSIANIRDMMFVLRKAKPGDKVEVTVVRDGEEVVLDVTYGKSRRR